MHSNSAAIELRSINSLLVDEDGSPARYWILRTSADTSGTGYRSPNMLIHDTAPPNIRVEGKRSSRQTFSAPCCASEFSNSKNRTRSLEFVGIYCGSLGDQSLDRLNLGRFWTSAVLESTKKYPAKWSNHFTPDGEMMGWRTQEATWLAILVSEFKIAQGELIISHAETIRELKLEKILTLEASKRPTAT